MGLFRRKKTDASVPAEIQDYYQAENRERTWVAWLLALVTLLVTVVVVLGLFFGGRLAYRKLIKQDKPAPVSVQTDTPQATPKPTTTPNPSTTQAPTNTPTAPSTQTPSTNTTPATSSNLPNTGPGDVLAIFAITTAVGAIAHNRVSRARQSRQN